MNMLLEIKDFGGARYFGFEIYTTNEVITLAIRNYQYCCEAWDAFISQDDTSEFIGALVSEIRVSDTDGNSFTLACDKEFAEIENLVKVREGYIDVLDLEFISIYTNKGKLQFTVYNNHNGFYGHETYIKVKNKKWKNQTLQIL